MTKAKVPANGAIAKAIMTRANFGVAEFTQVGELISEVLDGLAASNSGDNSAVEAQVRERVQALCRRFPIYPTL